MELLRLTLTLLCVKLRLLMLTSPPPLVEVANSLALVGLDRLERSFPILNQSTGEVEDAASRLPSDLKVSCDL